MRYTAQYNSANNSDHSYVDVTNASTPSKETISIPSTDFPKCPFVSSIINTSVATNDSFYKIFINTSADTYSGSYDFYYYINENNKQLFDSQNIKKDELTNIFFQPSISNKILVMKNNSEVSSWETASSAGIINVNTAISLGSTIPYIDFFDANYFMTSSSVSIKSINYLKVTASEATEIFVNNKRFLVDGRGYLEFDDENIEIKNFSITCNNNSEKTSKHEFDFILDYCYESEV